MRTTHTYCQRVWWREVINFRETKWVIISNPILLSTCNDRASGARDLVGMKTTPRARSNWFHTSLTWRQWPREPQRWQIPISPLNPHAVSTSCHTVSCCLSLVQNILQMKLTIGYFLWRINNWLNYRALFLYIFIEIRTPPSYKAPSWKACTGPRRGAAPQAALSTRRNELRLGLYSRHGY